MTVFVDTSALYAFTDRGDSRHGRAIELFSEHSSRLTTDHVLVEAWFLIERRLGSGVAEAVLENALAGSLEVEVVNRTDLDRAVDIRKAFPDQRFSLVDRTSFAVMERLAISGVMSFDEDFLIYRFGPRKRRAFDVLR